ncbi:Alpha/Beta hydrolase protein [Nemania sp. FL0916]|nr:Alpha/Beta hydrolase protein [Nemania sp. FL0916]
MALSNLLWYLYYKALVTVMRAVVFASGRHGRITALDPRGARRERGVKIPSRDRGRDIKAEIYYPIAASNQPLPVLVNWHGSGFIMPLFGADALYCSRVAQEVGIAVIDADYRKAPETPYPGAVNDVEDVLLWVASQKQRFDPNRIAVSGFSAGGNLALVAATKLRKKLAGVINIPVVVSLYPLINLAAPPEAKKVPKPVNAFPPWRLHAFNNCYAPDPRSRTDPAISPYFADPADFPGTVVLATCGGDVLKPEATELGKKLKRINTSGRKIFEHDCEGVRHGFDNGVIEDGSFDYARREELYTFVTNALKSVFSSQA